MDCRQARDLLMDDVREGFPLAKRPALEEHLSECKACETEAKSLREGWEALGSLELMAPPPHIRANLFRLMKAEMESERTPLFRLRRLLPASLAAALVSLGLAFVFPFQWLAESCQSWLGPVLRMAASPVEPFFFLAGVVYSLPVLSLALGLLAGRLEPSPGRSGAIAGALFFIPVSPYLILECLGLPLGSAISLISGFVAGTLISSSARAWVWRVRRGEVLA